jgi:cystathionine gamma-synthase
VKKQSENATIVVQWLSEAAATPKGQTFDGVPGGVVDKVLHSSLQGKDSHGWEPSQQLEGGWNATFSILVRFPGKCSVSRLLMPR